MSASSTAPRAARRAQLTESRPVRWTGYVISFAPAAFALRHRSRGRVSARAYSGFKLDRHQRP